MAKIFYIHGLGGGVKSSTFIGLCKHFDDVEILEYPSETATYDENFAIICNKFFAKVGNENFIIVGTSLGGYFASKLADEYLARGGDVSKMRAIFINPSTNPIKTANGLGYPNELVESYKDKPISKNSKVKPTIILAMDDELLDANECAELFEGFDVRKFPRGGHRCWEVLEHNIVACLNE